MVSLLYILVNIMNDHDSHECTSSESGDYAKFLKPITIYSGVSSTQGVPLVTAIPKSFISSLESEKSCQENLGRQLSDNLKRRDLNFSILSMKRTQEGIVITTTSK